MFIVVGVGVVGYVWYVLFSIKDHLEGIDASLHRLDDIRTDIGYVVGKLDDIKEQVKEQGPKIIKTIEDVGEKVGDIDSPLRGHILGELEDIKEKGEEIKEVIENVGKKIYDIEGLVDVIKDEMKSNESDES